MRRELAFNFARFSPALFRLDALPDWARATLAKHDKDRREFVYSRDRFERAATHDALWNAAQTELLTRGMIHGYYRMYWGKKIIEWSPVARGGPGHHDLPERPYALDGRDPNTYTNILWCFGLHDRPWAERPIFRHDSLHVARRNATKDRRGRLHSVHDTSEARMNIAISGASGFIGRALVARFANIGHTTRGFSARSRIAPSALGGCEAVVHLAGEPVSQRWTPAAKERIRSSRIEGTRHLVQASRRWIPGSRPFW